MPQKAKVSAAITTVYCVIIIVDITDNRETSLSSCLYVIIIKISIIIIIRILLLTITETKPATKGKSKCLSVITMSSCNHCLIL